MRTITLGELKNNLCRIQGISDGYKVWIRTPIDYRPLIEEIDIHPDEKRVILKTDGAGGK